MSLKEKIKTVKIPNEEGWYFLKKTPNDKWKPFYVDDRGYSGAMGSGTGHVDNTPFSWVWSERIKTPDDED